MTTYTRRGLLTGTASALALAAGCLTEDGGNLDDGASPDEPGSPGGGDPNESENDPDGGGDDDGDGSDDEVESLEVDDGLESADVVRYEHPDFPDRPSVELFVSATDAEDWIEDHEHLDEESAVAEALAETDFETAVAIAVEARASDLCHHLAVESVALEDGELAARAAVREDTDAGDMCAQQMTAVGAVIRATTTGDPPTAASVTITTEDGSTHGVGVAVGSDESGGEDRDSDGE